MINKQDNILVIVESPQKAKTISCIIKKAGFSKTTVLASVGHIIRLNDGGPAFNSGIYPDKDFQMDLGVEPEKKKVVDKITEAAKTVDKIIIMSDHDRAGEMIAWSLIRFCNLPENKCVRAVVHEITPSAVLFAIENPVPFDNNLVNAEFARIMTDKLIGWGLSPLGKKYIGAKSIGRCQSIGLKLVVDREKEILEFVPELYYTLYLKFIKNNTEFKAKYYSYKDTIIDKFTRKADIDATISDCKNTSFIIDSINTIKHIESPKPPFCTATFQQEAANKLGLKIKDAMNYAQKLFEGMKINGEHVGLITYMRTDSTEMSSEFITELKTFISNTYGADKYKTPRKSKSKITDQNGHEALRVTDINITPEKFALYVSNELLVKVYTLIWQRTIAAALPDATILETVYKIANTNKHKFIFSNKVLLDKGYHIIFNDTKNTADCNDELFSVGEIINNTHLEPTKHFTQPKPRFSEASLVKELEQLSIGRPSTYASIVETVLSPTRGYAKLEDKYIVPTDRGIQLANYCDRSFKTIINTHYTKQMEENLDKIANGKLNLLDYMHNFYTHFTSVVSSTSEVGLASDLETKLCPICGNAMVIRRSRFGKLFYGCVTYPKCRGLISIY